jgi:hypothetical protein
MKRFTVAIGLCAVIAAAPAAQMPKYGVTVTVDKQVDFAKFKTYAWTAGQPSADKQIDARVVAAVDRELEALGMTKATSGPRDVPRSRVRSTAPWRSRAGVRVSGSVRETPRR